MIKTDGKTTIAYGRLPLEALSPRELAVIAAERKGFKVLEASGPRAADEIRSAMTIAIVTGSNGARHEYCSAPGCNDDSYAVIERIVPSEELDEAPDPAETAAEAREWTKDEIRQVNRGFEKALRNANSANPEPDPFLQELLDSEPAEPLYGGY